MIGHLYRYPHPFDPTKFIYVGQGAKRDRGHRSGESSFGRKFKRDFPTCELPQPIREEFEVETQIELNELETIWMFRFHTWRRAYGGYNIVLPGSQDYKKFGKLGGEENVQNGWASELGKQSGLKAIQSGQIFALAESGIGGRIGGITVGNRHKKNKTGIFGLSKKQKSEAARKGGSIGGLKAGKIAVESGQLASLRTVEHQRIAGRAGAKAQPRSVRVQNGIENISKLSYEKRVVLPHHNQWHVNGRRSKTGKWCSPKPNPRCVLCSEQNLIIAYA